ncbi:hypothetical protein BRADI_2g20183v3 [Brachypodium distachyon]|uniref:Uncharacterized protein n=1 Tax=Brachypodium distachyon TaxID=15368 RepID=A0A0Q3IHY3_BRADI|nr:hypothetical protein BRADI_2g20183v3 [Brachypodium distachyon]
MYPRYMRVHHLYLLVYIFIKISNSLYFRFTEKIQDPKSKETASLCPHCDGDNEINTMPYLSIGTKSMR